MNTAKLIVIAFALVALFLAVSYVAYATLNTNTADDVVIEQNTGGVKYRFTDISDKGFDCKTIMWYGERMTCVDWDGVRE